MARLQILAAGREGYMRESRLTDSQLTSARTFRECWILYINTLFSKSFLTVQKPVEWEITILVYITNKYSFAVCKPHS